MRYMAPLFLSLVLVAQSPGLASSQEIQSTPPQKSAATGIAIGVGNLVVPLAVALATEGNGTGALALYSWIVGPFPGLWYAGDPQRGLKGVGVRAGLGLVLTGLAVAAFDDAWDGDSSTGLGVIATVAVAGTVGSWIADLMAIPDIIERNSSLGPYVGPQGGFGVGIQLRW